MAFEQLEDSASLFVNDRKETDNHPDRTGSAKIKCPSCGAVSEFWVSAWIKDLKSKPGKWLSIAFKKKDEPQPASAPAIDEDDDIPF